MLTSSNQQKLSSKSRPAKKINASLPFPTSECKTREEIPLEKAIQKKQLAASSSDNSEEVATGSSSKSSTLLSFRASEVKEELNRSDIVRAVLLKSNGSSEEISHDSKSRSVNKLLGGRPTIIGEFEDLKVIIIRLLSSYSSNLELNKHQLPTPFCNKSFNGDYLLYRINANGQSANFTLSEYNKYVESTKQLTEQAKKNFNPIDEKEIHKKSIYNAESNLTLTMLRSEADKKVREEFIKQNNRKPTESEIDESVEKTLQNCINELVKNTGSPMNDSDYSPDDDNDDDELVKKVQNIYSVEHNGDTLSSNELNQQFVSLKRTINLNELIDDDLNELDETDWREQLNEALHGVRARGRADGQLLAQKISQSFSDLNGNEPSLDELVDVFRRIKEEFSNEAQEDLLENGQNDNGSAYSLSKQIGDLSSANPSDLVNYAFRIVREDLISRAKSSFVISCGRTPTKSELESTIRSLTQKLAAETFQTAKKSVHKLNNNNHDEDSDYDPNNSNDQELFKKDLFDTRQYDKDFFNLQMIQSEPRSVKECVKYNVYFCKYNKNETKSNLQRAIKSFKKINERDPSFIELNNLKTFLKVDSNKNSKLIQFKLTEIENENEDDLDLNNNEEEKEAIEELHTTQTKVLVTPVKQKKNKSSRYNVYLSDTFDAKKNETFATKWFERFNNREPTKEEIENIKQFVQADKSVLTACSFSIPIDQDDDDDDAKESEISTPTKMKTKNIKNKTNSTKYTLNFADSDLKTNGDKKRAAKWFKRFNKRSPSKDEKENISKFINKDNNINSK